MFLFFAASLLPDPDIKYQPSVVNACTWLVSLAFEICLSIVGSICLKADMKNRYPDDKARDLYITLLLLAYARITCLAGAAILFYLPLKSSADPAAASLLCPDSEESSYGSMPTSSPPSPIVRSDAQSTNWLDYLVGLGQLLPRIW